MTMGKGTEKSLENPVAVVSAPGARWFIPGMKILTLQPVVDGGMGAKRIAGAGS